MNWTITPFSILFLIPAAVMLGLALFIWMRHTNKPGRILSYFMFSISLWNLSNFIEVSAVSSYEKFFWQKIVLIFTETSVLLFLVFAISLTERQRWFTRRWISLGVVPAVLFVIFAATNEHHYLYWKSYAPSPANGSNLLIFEHGPGLWANLVFLYLTFAVANVIIFSTATKKSSNLYADSWLLGISICIPLVTNGVQLKHGGPFPGLDMTSISFLVPSIIFSYILNKLQMMSLMPISRSKLIEHMSDSILVLNNFDQILDLNPAAQSLFGISTEEAIGSKVQSVFQQWPEILNSCCEKPAHLQEVSMNGIVMDMRITVLNDHANKPIGRLIICRDITEQKHTEQAEVEHRLFAEALTNSAEAINSSLDLEDVFDSILKNLDTVVPHDVSNILMIDSEGYATIACSRGYEESNVDFTFIQAVHVKVEDIPSYFYMVKTKKPFIVANTHSDPSWITFEGHTWIRSYLGAPILVKGNVVGFINLDSKTPGFFTQQHAEHLQAFTEQAAIAVENARLFTELQKIAITDELTGLFNRRHLFTLGEVEFERCRRYRHLLSAILLDIDWFKQVNDTYGHLTGDLVLREVGHLCLESTRKVDIVGRYGGEEILILLPETHIENTASTAERLRKAIEDLCIHSEQGDIHITASFGVAYFNPYSDKRLIELIERADEALYTAKRSGRNQICVYSYGSASPDQVMED